MSAAFWGLYWFPLRTIEATGITGSWSIVFFNACPLFVLMPLLLFQLRSLAAVFWPTVLAGLLIGLAFTLYATGLVETTIVRATLLYYLTPVWSTLIGVLWLSEKLTMARIVAIVVAFVGMYFLLSASGTDALNFKLNIGDLCALLSGIFWAMGIAVLNRWASIPILPVATFIFISTTLISAVAAGWIYADPVPLSAQLVSALPTAAFWSICVLLPCFCIIFRASQLLFPGRVGILTMSEVIVAIASASILVPEETMTLIQWMGAAAILLAGLVEVVFGYRLEDNSE